MHTTHVHMHTITHICTYVATCMKNKNPRKLLEMPMSQVMMIIDIKMINIPTNLF